MAIATGLLGNPGEVTLPPWTSFLSFMGGRSWIQPVISNLGTWSSEDHKPSSAGERQRPKELSLSERLPAPPVKQRAVQSFTALCVMERGDWGEAGTDSRRTGSCPAVSAGLRPEEEKRSIRTPA